MARHFLAFSDFTAEEMAGILALAADLKAKLKKGQRVEPLRGKVLAMIFQKPSSRTRASFEAGMFQLGGHAINLAPDTLQLGVREPARDIGRILSRYGDGMMARLFSHVDIEELARYADVPVINGLTDLYHPCQVLADIMTILEHRGSLDGLTLAYLGDGNNMANTWLDAATRIPMSLAIATPPGYGPDATVARRAVEAGLSTITISHDPQEAIAEAEILYADVWTSMGQERERQKRLAAFAGFQLNARLLGSARPDALIMHCLPAHRGEEITDEVLEGPRSIVFDQAENRLHAQKAVLVKLLG
ncbi:MAG: ornithine carbamoyltransferase [Candidatus Latescibacteria bacterium]|nr:ornithine carbamoyltransferase [Candidatus Latescibacterota bacterium]